MIIFLKIRRRALSAGSVAASDRVRPLGPEAGVVPSPRQSRAAAPTQLQRYASVALAIARPAAPTHLHACGYRAAVRELLNAKPAPELKSTHDKA